MSAPAALLVGALTLASTAALRAAATANRRSVVGSRLGRGRPLRAGAQALAAPGAPAIVARRLTAAGLDDDRWWLAWLAAVTLTVPVAVVAGGSALALVAGAVAVIGPVAALGAASGRADRLLEQALPEALEAMARALRSSASLRQAIEEAAATTPGRLGVDLDAVATEVANGETLARALDRWGERRPLPGVRLAVSALGLGAETGGAHARAVDGVAATIRSRLAVGREVRALASQARLSAMVITLAPLGFSALATATDDRTADFLLRTPLGLACLSAGLLLDGVAALWMHRLSRIDP